MLRLLVVEDEAPIMALVRRALEPVGYTVVGVNSGAQALELLASHPFDGIISDMRTPGNVSGGGVYQWIKANRPELARKIVFVTGDIANEDTVAILRETGAPCVEKPFRLQNLIDTEEKTIGTPTQEQG